MNRYETMALGFLLGMLAGHLLTLLGESWRKAMSIETEKWEVDDARVADARGWTVVMPDSVVGDTETHRDARMSAIAVLPEALALLKTLVVNNHLGYGHHDEAEALLRRAGVLGA